MTAHNLLRHHAIITNKVARNSLQTQRLLTFHQVSMGTKKVAGNSLQTGWLLLITFGVSLLSPSLHAHQYLEIRYKLIELSKIRRKKIGYDFSNGKDSRSLDETQLEPIVAQKKEGLLFTYYCIVCNNLLLFGKGPHSFNNNWIHQRII